MELGQINPIVVPDNNADWKQLAGPKSEGTSRQPVAATGETKTVDSDAVVKTHHGPTSASLPSPSKIAKGGAILAPIGSVCALLALNALQVICICYLLLAGILYRALPDKELAAFLDLYALSLPSTNFRIVGTVHFVLAALHLGSLTWHLLSNRRRRSPERKLQARKQPKPAASASSPVRLVRNAMHALDGIMDGIFGSRGLFGIESDHFDVLFLLREIVEISLQANQAYRMSQLVPRDGLNRFYIIVLVLNCWMSTLVHWWIKRKSLQRLVCVLSDVLLDFVTAIGVPVVLTASYIQGYDRERGNFPYSNWYNDPWVVNFMNESTIVLFGSWFDAFSRLVFSVSLLLCLDDARQLIRPSNNNQVIDPSRERTVSSRLQSALRVASAIGKSKRIQRIVRFGRYAMALVGTVLLVLHIQAVHKTTTPFCRLEVHPWLTRRPACALLELSCRTRTSPPTLDAVLTDLDGHSLAHIVLRHCQDVTVPPQIQRFPSLLGLKVYNTSIAAWPADAALDEQHHKMLRFAYFVRCHFPGHELPDGLVSRQFPSMLRDLEFTITNLRTLPTDLHTRWPEYVVLWIEFAELTEVPSTLLSMSLWNLALTGNPISRIDPELLTRPQFHELGIAATAVTTLPELDSSKVDLEVIQLQYSNLSALPSWMDDAFLRRCTLMAGATPLCRWIRDETNSSSLDPKYELIICDEDGVDSIVYYPLGLEEASD